MKYGRLAEVYEICERLVFGRALQRCRTTYLESLPLRVLSVGEGDGRFSEALVALRPEIELTVLEPDGGMLAKAKTRHLEETSVSFTRDWSEVGEVDAVVLNFVLDSCSEQDADDLLAKAESVLTEGGVIIVGDFFPDEVSGAMFRLLLRGLTAVMYGFFRLSVGLQVSELPPVRDLLSHRGYGILKESVAWRGFIRAQWWEKQASGLSESRVSL